MRSLEKFITAQVLEPVIRMKCLKFADLRLQKVWLIADSERAKSAQEPKRDALRVTKESIAVDT